MISTIQVKLWGRIIGAASLKRDGRYVAFQYDPEFANSGIQISPITMPLSNKIYMFPNLSLETFHGLPGLLADSLPDKFGNAIIDSWFASSGRDPRSLTAIDRLAYLGKRGMGALEFLPNIDYGVDSRKNLNISDLVQLASDVLTKKQQFTIKLENEKPKKALKKILMIGSSAGGARAKAIIAWNRETNEIRSGQVNAGEGFDYWLIKFDGVASNKDKEFDDPMGFGSIEYAYYLMAKASNITMSESTLLEESGRKHFITKRFDRDNIGKKLHMQSLGSLAHFDFNIPRVYSYEQALQISRYLKLPLEALEQLMKRMIFNVITRNQDDHVKNISFLMNKSGEWSLAPAYDMTFSFNQFGDWTSKHQMSINGKVDDFTLSDFYACGKTISMKPRLINQIIDQTISVVNNWQTFAKEAKVDQESTEHIANCFRKKFEKT